MGHQRHVQRFLVACVEDSLRMRDWEPRGVPGEVAERISKELTIPTIGIGAGNGCDGQVLVWQDAFGLRTGKMARFVKQYADVHGVLLEAARAYADDVRGGTFPGPDHTF